MLPAIDTDALLTFLTGLLNTASPTGYAEPAIAFTEVLVLFFMNSFRFFNISSSV